VTSPVLWSILALLAGAAAAVVLLYALMVLRESSRAYKAAAEAVRESARLHERAAEASRAALQAAQRMQELASRPALKLFVDIRGHVPDVSNAPVIFCACAANVGHGTAVIERVRVSYGGAVRVEYTGTGGDVGRLQEQFDREVFQRITGVGLEALSAQLTYAVLTDSTRALEVGGRLELFSVQLFAHNAHILERGFRELGVGIGYRSLSGAWFETAEQFAGLRLIEA